MLKHFAASFPPGHCAHRVVESIDMRPIYRSPAKVPARLNRPLRSKRRRGSRAMLGAMAFFGSGGFAAVCLAGSTGYLPDLGFLLDHSRNLPNHISATTGMILFTSPNVDTCREQLFDNTTGRQRDNGVVDCKNAIYEVKQSQVTMRMNAIGDTFRK